MDILAFGLERVVIVKVTKKPDTLRRVIIRCRRLTIPAARRKL